jgi:hypothetical protein
LTYSLFNAQKKQAITNFYDVTNPGIGGLALVTVTGGQYGSNVQLAQYIANATAITANLGFSAQTAIILKQGFFSQQYPQYTLVHEIILHAYVGAQDSAIFNNSYFAGQGLWRPTGSSATSNITDWMTTDCTCTPGNPATPACQAKPPTW